MRRATLVIWFLVLYGGEGLQAAEVPGVPTEKPAGSGVIVHPDGYILTAYHVVSNARRIVVVTSGEFRAPAVIVSADREQDLALLKIETVGLSEATIGYAGAVRLAQEVVVVGFSFGLREVSVAHGRIAAVRTRGVKRVFQVDAAINPGNSGGAVFNRRGEVIGIMTTKFSHPSGIAPEGMGFAVPISYATPLLANIPDFDFTAIGRERRAPKVDAEEMIREMTRATVQIETARVQEPSATPAGQADSHAGQSKGAARRDPLPRVQPGSVPSDHVAEQDAVTVAVVNRQLQTAQEKELNNLAAQGIAPPEGMVLVPAGEFLMGEEDGLPDARPMHRSVLSAFWIDKYEVTNAQYRACVLSGVCTPPKDRQAFDDLQRDRYPVANVTWNQARVFCQWSGRRLPTEAEWEKAARGTDGRRYPWGNSEEPIKRVVKERERRGDTNGIEPVGSVAGTESPYGVFDLVGNVWEWVKDWYAEDFYAVASPHDPQGPLRGSFRVLRGGDWSQSPLELRASYRGWDEMTYWGAALGFRCATDVP